MCADILVSWVQIFNYAQYFPYSFRGNDELPYTTDRFKTQGQASLISPNFRSPIVH